MAFMFKEGLFYISKGGNYEMFHAWSLGKPCGMEMFLDVFIYDSMGIVWL